MSRLVNPGAGDYADRLTILALKLLFGEQAGKDVTHFRNERNAILPKLLGRDNGKWLEAYTELAAVNAALWHAEDELRGWRERLAPTPPDSTGLRGPGEGYKAAVAADVVQLAFRIQALNDQRAALIATINQKAGDARPEEQEKVG